MSTWKEAISVTLPSEAHMIQGYLSSEGIESILKDELTTQINTFYSNAVGGVKVMVSDLDFDNAQQILEKGGYLHPEAQQKVEVVYRTKSTNTQQCPFCHSEHIGKKKIPDVLMAVVSVLFGHIFPIFRRVNHCYDCGKEWIYKRRK